MEERRSILMQRDQKYQIYHFEQQQQHRKVKLPQLCNNNLSAILLRTPRFLRIKNITILKMSISHIFIAPKINWDNRYDDDDNDESLSKNTQPFDGNFQHSPISGQYPKKNFRSVTRTCTV